MHYSYTPTWCRNALEQATRAQFSQRIATPPNCCPPLASYPRQPFRAVWHSGGHRRPGPWSLWDDHHHRRRSSLLGWRSVFDGQHARWDNLARWRSSGGKVLSPVHATIEVHLRTGHFLPCKGDHLRCSISHPNKLILGETKSATR